MRQVLGISIFCILVLLIMPLSSVWAHEDVGEKQRDDRVYMSITNDSPNQRTDVTFYYIEFSHPGHDHDWLAPTGVGGCDLGTINPGASATCHSPWHSSKSPDGKPECNPVSDYNFRFMISYNEGGNNKNSAQPTAAVTSVVADSGTVSGFKWDAHIDQKFLEEPCTLAPPPPADPPGVALDDDDEVIVIPDWFKNNAIWWRDGKITDIDIINAIESLMGLGIIPLGTFANQPTEKGGTIVDVTEERTIPNYIKELFGWWADGLVPDSDIANSLGFLISTDIIRSPSFSEISGLDLEDSPIDYREGDEDTTVRKLTGIPKYTNVVLKHGLITQGMNEAFANQLLNIKDYEFQFFRDSSNDAWQLFGENNNDSQLREQAIRLQDTSDEFEVQVNDAIELWQNSDKITDHVKQVSLDNGIPILELENALMEPSNIIENIQPIQTLENYDQAYIDAYDIRQEAGKRLGQLFDEFNPEADGIDLLYFGTTDRTSLLWPQSSADAAPADWELITPRISFTYDITGDGKNVVKLSNPQFTILTEIISDDGNWYRLDVPTQQAIDFDGELFTNSNLVFCEGYDCTNPRDYNTPYLDELTLTFEKALTDDLAVSLTGFYKKQNNLPSNDGPNLIEIINDDLSDGSADGKSGVRLLDFPSNVAPLPDPLDDVFSQDLDSFLLLDSSPRITEYNDSPASILAGYITGSVDIQPIDDEWSSGEEIPVIVYDHNYNQNNRGDGGLDLSDPDIFHIPTLQTGDPLTLDGLTVADLPGYGELLIDTIQPVSDRAILVVNDDVKLGDGDSFDLTFGTMEDFFDASPINDDDFHGFALFNYDIRSLTDNVSGIESLDINLAGIPVATRANPQGLILLDDELFGSLDGATPLIVEFQLNDENSSGLGTLNSGETLPIVADIFGFGFLNDGLEGGERIANQIIRLELEEAGDNAGLFEGSLEYIMINQLNVLDPSTYEDLSTIADDPNFIVIEDLTDEDSPRVNYLEIIDDGLPIVRSDQEEAPTHSGIVSFDLDTYKVADTVIITLQDLDLNVDSDLIDIYTTVTDSNDPAFGSIGEPGLPVLSDGDALGRVLDVTFDDELWTTPQGDCLDDLLDDTGLGATGFTLIETDRDNGKFIGDWQIPAQWCRSDNGDAETTTGLDLEVNYVDFRDASGEIIKVNSDPIEILISAGPPSDDSGISDPGDSGISDPGDGATFDIFVYTFDFAHYPVGQFTLWRWPGECDDQWHLHTPTGHAVNLGLTGMSDPDPNDCGWGKISELNAEFIEVSQSQVEAFHKKTGVHPVIDDALVDGGDGMPVGTP